MDIALRMLNSLLMFAIPLALAAWVARRFRLEWRIFLIGAGTFVGSQVLHLPANRFLLQPLIEKLGLLGADQGWPLFSLSLLFGASAGLFEEIARYIVYRLWLRDERRWEGGLFFGLGHGGIEAILLGALTIYVLLQATAYRNADLAGIVPPEQLELARAQLDAYWTAPWYAALLGALERVFAIGIQISLAVIVLQVFTRRNHLWLILAILWHMIVDVVAVFGVSTWGIYVTELAIGLLAALSLVFLYFLRPKETGEELSLTEVEAEIPDIHRLGVRPPNDLPKDRLDDSRYDQG